MLSNTDFPFTRSDAEWREILTPERFAVNVAARQPYGLGAAGLPHEKRQGVFSCAGCGQLLFASNGKFESGTGWPSFNDPLEGSF